MLRLRKALLVITRGIAARVTLGALLALAFLTAGCGGPVAPTPTATPRASVTATLPGYHVLIVTSALKGEGTVIQLTQLAAIDLTTGHQVWTRAIMGGPSPFAPARAANTIVASASIPASPYPASQLAAFDIRTGASLWSRAFAPNTQAVVGTTGAAIIVVTSPISIEAPGALPGLTIAALNPMDGTSIWQRSLTHQELYAPIQAANGVVYVLGGQSSGTNTSYVLTALDATTGTPRWQATLGAGSLLGAVAGDGLYYVGLYPAHLAAFRHAAQSGAPAVSRLSPFAASTLTAYRASDGTRAWQVASFAAPQREVGSTLYTTTATPDSSGYLGFSLAALKAATGAQLWQASQLGRGDPTSKPFAAADAGGVYAFAMPGAPSGVRALKATTGESLWSAQANMTVEVAVVGLGSVFTATVPATPAGRPPKPAHVTITALRADIGVVQWTLDIDQSQAATLVLT